MLDINKIKGIIFDYGGTIDSNGKHWAEVLWEAYEDNHVPVSKKDFRDAYVYAERYLATHHVIEPVDTFNDLLKKKVDLQINWLVSEGFLPSGDKTSQYSLAVSNQCYNFARSTVEKARLVLNQLFGKYPMVLVSNFYGNIEAVLKDFNLLKYFIEIVESAVVGVRKPDPAIFALGVKILDLPVDSVTVIGDSYKKDIAPAHSLGCSTIWIKGPSWENEAPELTAEAVISDFSELKDIFQL